MTDESWIWPGRMARLAYEQGWFHEPYTERKPLDDGYLHGAGCQCPDCMWDETEDLERTDS